MSPIGVKINTYLLTPGSISRSNFTPSNSPSRGGGLNFPLLKGGLRGVIYAPTTKFGSTEYSNLYYARNS
jgi:hypothetical protein